MAEREPHYAGVPPETLPPVSRHPIHVVLDNFRSAYNVGSAFRTADAAAVAHVHLCGMSAHPPHRKIEKTALGAFDYVPWTYHERVKDCLAALRADGVPIVAIEVADGATPFTDFAWPQPVAVVFGNEVTGINESVLRQCDGVACIPMYGHKNSVNVATAIGVILYGILTCWQQAGPV
ncbi:MAG TPA: TrmH family RNA methyltransferase [Candidatus Hydrogenedentes bacterium]|nr:TrmH family RNA methyltransferase [Candidatus Hydrogenedentota bacterium]HNT87438.1 TrmH family RNA methyltransferase [Candidatus Hydrogenedentota bacterium]